MQQENRGIVIQEERAESSIGLVQHDLAPIPKERTALTEQPPKEIIIRPGKSKMLDKQTVAFRYYNSFNYSLLQKHHEGVRFAVGITSANQGEGKSLVASNLAVSLTLGYKKKTVLVDLNTSRPVLHEIFGTGMGPGLIEALNDGDIHLWQTPIDHLHLLSSGGKANRDKKGEAHSQDRERFLEIDQMTAFADVITSLQMEYEFVVVDMPAINAEDFPILFANRLDGLLMVVDSTSTKRNEMEKVFRRVNEQQVLGFVLNRMNDAQE